MNSKPGEPGFIHIARREDLKTDDTISQIFTDRCNNLGMPSTETTVGGAAAACADPSRFNVIFYLHRPGSRLAMVSLEIKLFPPHTALNAAFLLYLMPWHGLPFAVVSMPESPSCRKAVSEILAECGLMLCDAVPIAVVHGNAFMHGNSRYGQRGWQILARHGHVMLFPMHGDNSFGTETIVGSRIYSPEEETMLAKAVWNEWEMEHGKHTKRQKS